MTRQSSASPAGANVEHTIGIDAPPGTVYRLIADITGWPQFLRSVVHAEVVEDRLVGGERREQLVQLRALAGDRVQTWTSRRVLDPRPPGPGPGETRARPSGPGRRPAGPPRRRGAGR
ncbi:SRPBCC family protein [Streptomyces sp. JJ38]|uniref:SRPBCC family protein n=1 Tax=Streptomyces sp. JJ38 TaxID=2738128 RepID=UPI001C563F55|nr:SRPBCC family protein [Streptomyces sp. JJ38]MBW1598421.1 hypothetical protein [Streptomyces sp. JJ38]